MSKNLIRFVPAIPVVAAVLAVGALTFWMLRGPGMEIAERVPGTDAPPGADGAAAMNPVLAGKVIRGEGQPSNLPGAWIQFRGTHRDGIQPETAPLAKVWDAGAPRELWSVELGEGYSGPAVLAGRVYLTDYDTAKKQSALRCLSLADGREIWRFAYAISIKRNHGMTRTTPALTEKYAVVMDSKCNVFCVDAATGELRWGINLVHDYAATIPPWYTGQCPLIDGNAVILAPAGRDVMMLAVDIESGKPLWQSPNPRGWKMTHSSVMPVDFGGQRIFVYCGSGGVVGVSAKDGAILWDTSAWKISIATVPSPLVLNDGKIFLSGGYNAGSVMLQLKQESDKIVPTTLLKLSPEIFGATQHTPIYSDGHIFGVRADGQFVCLDSSGKIAWTSGPGTQFGLGSFMMAENSIFVLNDSGKLSLIEASSTKYVPLAQAQVLKGRESWGPMALVGGRLLARDLTRMVCLDVSAKGSGSATAP